MTHVKLLGLGVVLVTALSWQAPAADAQVVTSYYAPTPYTTYYANPLPVRAYYQPTPVTTYYGSTTSYYAPAAAPAYVPTTTYYAPSTSYYAPTYAPAPVTTYYAPYVVRPPYVPGQPVRNFFRGY